MAEVPQTYTSEIHCSVNKHIDIKMGSENGTWELYYWPGFPGRGEFVRLVFEEAGVKYKDIQENITDLIIKNQHGGFPAYAPPMIKKGDFELGQTSVICRYLAKKHDLYPEKEEDQWHADQISQTAHDYIAEGFLVFHGHRFRDSYESQKEETQRYINWFVRERIERWFGFFETALSKNNGGTGFLVGDKLSFADLALLHILRATEAQFPEEFKRLDSIPLLKSFKERISARPNLAAYFESPRCRPFSGDSFM